MKRLVTTSSQTDVIVTTLFYLRPPNKPYEIDDVNHVANGVECDCTWNTETLSRPTRNVPGPLKRF